MTDIEKRARELLAEACERQLMPVAAEEVRSGSRDGIPAMQAIVAALTPAEGFVLVPVEPTQEMVDQGTHCTHAEDWEVRSAWIYMLSHRPEVK